MAHVERLTVYPVKSLSPQDRESVRVAESGALAGDREWSLYAPPEDGGDPELLNGKRTTRVHDVDTALDGTELTVETPADRGVFDLERERGAAEAFLSTALDADVELRRNAGGNPDRDGTITVVSTATLEAVADWFDDVTVDGLRRRLRSNVEVAGVDPFWEDRFASPDAPAFAVGDPPVRVEGVEPCGRCVVPTRDPDTGDQTPGFRERFVAERRANYPAWVAPEAMPHDFTLTLVAAVPERFRDRTLSVGDAVRVQK